MDDNPFEKELMSHFPPKEKREVIKAAAAIFNQTAALLEKTALEKEAKKRNEELKASQSR